MVNEIVNTVRKAFNSGITKPQEFRQNQLKALLRLYEENTAAMVQALAKDLKKSKQEAMITEISVLINNVKILLMNLNDWMKPEKPTKNLINLMDEVLIQKEPYGVVLIIGPWNYPVQLIFAPLAGAIATGNCAILKPSELAPYTAQLIADLIPKYLNKDCYKVINGGIPETTALLQNHFDYIFFTGSTTIGKIVYQNAAKYLTPVTLELGGKSPVFIDDTVDIDIVARRIWFGKCINAGQSCIAPDYILCNKNIEGKLIEATKMALKDFYGDKVKQNPDFGRIINENHFKRIVKLLEGQQIALGGNYDVEEQFIEPTIVINPKANDAIMQEEIFGPVLPIYNVGSVVEAVEFINKREKPLALYVFSKNRKTVDFFLNNTSSGGVCINDTMMHFSVDTLPFGGVGNSGIGAYHGKYTFDTFSHKRGVLVKKINKFQESLLKPRYPPFSDGKLNTLLRLTKPSKGFLPANFFCYLFVFVLGILLALLGVFLRKLLN